MKTYTLNFTSSQGRVKRTLELEAIGLPQAIFYSRGAITAMLFYMVDGENLTCTIHHNGELIWEESCTK